MFLSSLSFLSFLTWSSTVLSLTYNAEIIPVLYFVFIPFVAFSFRLTSHRWQPMLFGGGQEGGRRAGKQCHSFTLYVTSYNIQHIPYNDCSTYHTHTLHYTQVMYLKHCYTILCYVMWYQVMSSQVMPCHILSHHFNSSFHFHFHFISTSCNLSYLLFISFTHTLYQHSSLPFNDHVYL